MFLFLNRNIFLGSQKNRLNETVLLSSLNMLKLMDKKMFTILRTFVLFIQAYVDHTV